MIVDCAVYEDGCRRDGQLDLDQAFEAAQAENAFVWIGLYEPSEKELKWGPDSPRWRTNSAARTGTSRAFQVGEKPAVTG